MHIVLILFVTYMFFTKVLADNESKLIHTFTPFWLSKSKNLLLHSISFLLRPELWIICQGKMFLTLVDKVITNKYKLQSSNFNDKLRAVCAFFQRYNLWKCKTGKVWIFNTPIQGLQWWNTPGNVLSDTQGIVLYMYSKWK